ncbi:hypothetical protein Q1695_000905 [Nippostrongylus brasiliensis]|nr:hypothetical protein Q1695_000905 [Nippostrongylus brasiliensis]
MALVSSRERKSFALSIYQFVANLLDEVLDAVVTLLTRKKRLERVLLGVYKFRAAQMEMIEKCTVKHRGLRLRKNSRDLDRSEEILKKELVQSVGPQRVILRTRLHDALNSIAAYETLCEQVEKLRKEEYQRGNAVHEGKLLELWRLLKPDDKISACTGKHWRTLGFQSDDPSRDFRGMGILSLDQLIYMARNEPRCMRSIVVLSNHPRIGFPLVITGINITSLCHHLLTEGLLKNHFHNTLEKEVELEDFHKTFCKIFSLFAEYWKKENPPSIMSFNNVRMNFERILIPQLRSESSQLSTVLV